MTAADLAAIGNWENKYLDPDYDMALHRCREPTHCLACGSIENNGERCSWCHSKLEVS